MNKKDYQEPTMMVVKLQHRENVLQSSVQDNQVGMRNYSVESYDEE